MGGQHAIRGYIKQTLIAVFDSLEDKNWLSVCVEPDDESEKVDIRWTYNDNSKKVMQVKSSKNPFQLSSANKWAKELEDGTSDASEYILYLVGRVSDNLNPKVNNKIGKVLIKNVDIGIEDFNAIILSKINEFFEKNSRTSISQKLGQLFIFSLNQQFLLNSAFGKTLNRTDFEKGLLSDLSDINNYLEKKSPYVHLLPPQDLKHEDLKTTIIKHILHLIGWNNLIENETATSYNQKKGEDESFSVDFWGSYNSHLKDNEHDIIYVNSMFEAEYPSCFLQNIQQNTFSIEQVRNKLISTGRIDFCPVSEHSIQFYLSTKESELDSDLTNEIKNYYKSSILNRDIIYYVVDTKKANFLISSIITAKNYREELPVKFLYPITEAISSEEKIGKRNTFLPPQYINSSVIPIIKEDKNKISVMLFCSDAYSKERLKKIIWMLIRLTSGLSNEYLIYFTDYNNSYENEVNEVLRSYNDDELTKKLHIKKLYECDTTKLNIVPQIENELLDECYDENNCKKHLNINTHLNEYLPYGDYIKPFLASDVVSSQILKIFLSHKGIYFKTADKTKIIHLMTSLLFSPMEIEELVGFVETKDRISDNSTIDYPLIESNTKHKILNEIFNPKEVSKGLDIEISSPIEFNLLPGTDEYTCDLYIEKKNPNKLAMVNTVVSSAKITAKFNYAENKLEFYNSHNSKDAKVVVERIVKTIANDFISKNIIEDKVCKVMFTDFNNKERVNFLLSFANIESSEFLKEHNTRSFKYKFDESIDLPEEYKDKIGKECINQSTGKNLDGLKELQDNNFKEIILCEEIVMNYKFIYNAIRGNFLVILNFSDALKNKPNYDGQFHFRSKVYLDNKNKQKVPNVLILENTLKQDFRRLQKEKIQIFNKE